jgi:predicted AlkP superfamily pyrophosphatase or phosphodiesterase
MALSPSPSHEGHALNRRNTIKRQTIARGFRYSVFAATLGLAVCNNAIGSPVLLISIDGMRPDYVTHADEHGLKIAALRQLMREGSYAEAVINAAPAVTYPNHTTLITGASPAEHGIYANRPFDPDSQNGGGWYWYARDVKVPTLWQAANSAGLVTASVAWPVTVAAPGIRYNVPEYGDGETTDNAKILEALARPNSLLTDFEAHLGPYSGKGTEDGDAVRARFAVEILKKYKPSFMTVHLVALDARSHEHGPFSPEANQALEVLDGLIAQLRDAQWANDRKAAVAVVSDHGFSRIEHVLNWRIPFLRAGLLTLQEPMATGVAPDLASWKAMLWNGGGSAAVMLKNPQDPQLRAQVKAVLGELKANPENGIARVLEEDEIKKLGGWPGATFVIDMKPQYALGNAWSSAQVTSESSPHGQHGFLPDDPDMHSSFFIMGDGIAHGRNLGTIDMCQIAPTLAQRLGVRLPSARKSVLHVGSAP